MDFVADHRSDGSNRKREKPIRTSIAIVDGKSTIDHFTSEHGRWFIDREVNNGVNARVIE